MKIVTRNLMRLLRAGMFHDFDEIEPMSAFKWRRLMQQASAMGVAGVAARGARNFQFGRSPMPDTSLFDVPDNADTYEKMADEAQRDKQFANPLLNRRLQRIYREETKAEEPSPETVQMLNLLIFNTTSLLASDVCLQPLLVTGMFLRRNGDMVDFLKLQAWIERIGMQRFASLTGTLLTDALGFSPDEVPFVTQRRDEAAPMLEQNISRAVAGQASWRDDDTPYFSQNSAGFVMASGQKFRRSVRTTLRFFTYSPAMATGAFLHQLSKNLKDIEE